MYVTHPSSDSRETSNVLSPKEPARCSLLIHLFPVERLPGKACTVCGGPCRHTCHHRLGEVGGAAGTRQEVSLPEDVDRRGQLCKSRTRWPGVKRGQSRHSHNSFLKVLLLLPFWLCWPLSRAWKGSVEDGRSFLPSGGQRACPWQAAHCLEEFSPKKLLFELPPNALQALPCLKAGVSCYGLEVYMLSKPC